MFVFYEIGAFLIVDSLLENWVALVAIEQRLTIRAPNLQLPPSVRFLSS
jgi:hypothetical protein